MDEEEEHVEMDEEQMDKDEMDKEQIDEEEMDEEEMDEEEIDEEEMDEEEMDEEEEHVEMDDRGRMKDLAPVSHWQGQREREKGTCYNFRQSTTAPPLISNITCLPLTPTAQFCFHTTSTQVHQPLL